MMGFNRQGNNYMDKDKFDMTAFCRNNFTYSFIVVLSLHCTGFSLVVVNSGYSVVAVWASHCGGLSLWSMGSRVFVPASVVAAYGLSSCCS